MLFRSPGGPYNIIYKIGNSPCTDADTFLININEQPEINFTGITTICTGDTTTLSASGGVNYSWSPSSGLSSSIISSPEAFPSTTTTYYVTVTNADGCSATDSVMLSVTARPTADAGKDTMICIGDSVQLYGSGSSYLNWEPSTGLDTTNISDPWASPQSTTDYILTVGQGICTDKDTVNVTVIPLPTADAGEDIRIIQGQEIRREAVFFTGYDYLWTDSAELILNNILLTDTPYSDKTYYLIVTDNHGCTNRDLLRVITDSELIIYNTFTPNGDGVNDTWQIKNIGTYEHEVSVFGRSGMKIFNSSDYTQNEWNGTFKGKPVPAASYYYLITIETENQDIPQLIKGCVTLIK